MHSLKNLAIVLVCFVGLNSSLTAGELHDAAAKGDVKKVKAMIAAGADLNALDGKGRTPLNCTCDKWGGHSDKDKDYEDIILALIDAGANVNATVEDEMSAIMTAASEGRLSVVKKLVAHGAELGRSIKLESFCKGGLTALDFAAGSKEVWRYLRLKGAESGRMDYDKALCDAAARGNPEAVAYFLQKGGDPNAKSDHVFYDWEHPVMGLMPWSVAYRDITALHYACFEGSESAVRLLVEKGASVTTPDANGQTPLDFALFRGHKEVVSFLRSVKAKEGVGRERMHIRAAVENLTAWASSPRWSERSASVKIYESGSWDGKRFNSKPIIRTDSTPLMWPDYFWSNCTLTGSHDFSVERPDKQPKKPDDIKGAAITFKAEWGGCRGRDEQVSFRNGMIGGCEALGLYVKEGTEAKTFGKQYRFEKGSWVEIRPPVIP